MADPADTADEGSQRDTTLRLHDRNAAVFAAANAARREEFEREAAEIGGAELPDDDPHPDQHPDAGSPDGRAAEPGNEDAAGAAGAAAATAQDAPTDDETVEVKVDGKTERVAKADVDAAGGVAAFQKAKAADRRLAEAAERARMVEDSEARLRARAKALGIDYETGHPITPRAGGDAGSKPAAAPTTDAPTSDELEAAIKEHAQDINLAADPDKTEASLRRVIQAAAKAVTVDKDTIKRVVAEHEQVNRSRSEWNSGWAGNEDVLGDPDAKELARALMRRAMIEDLVKGGADPDAAARLSDDQLGGYHMVARQHGAGRQLPDIMSLAISTTRQRLGLTKPAASTDESGTADRGKPTGTQGRGSATPRPAATAIARRQELKGGTAVATSTPASSAASNPRPKLSMGNTGSEYVANLRKARGQPPLGPVP